MDTYFATGQAEGCLLNRVRLQRAEDGQTFALFDLADAKEMYTLPPCRCAAEGAVAQALAFLMVRGEGLALRGSIRPFERTLPTGEQLSVENVLHVSEFRILEDNEPSPEALPV